MSKIKLSGEDYKTYGIRNQQDLDRLQKVWSDKMGIPVEFESFEGISGDMRDYLIAKGVTPAESNQEQEHALAESVISVSDIQEFLKSKNK